MIDYFETVIKELESQYEIFTGLHICALISQKGYGKRTAVENFIGRTGNHSIIDIEYNDFNAPIIDVAYAFEKIKENKIINGTSVIDNSINRSFIDGLFYKIIQYIKMEKTILILDNLQTFLPDTRAFIIKLISYFYKCNDKFNLFVIFMSDISGEDEFTSDFLAPYTNKTYYIHMKNWETQDLTDLFFDLYPNADIAREDLSAIINCSFKNQRRFLATVEYLKSNAIFVNSQGKWVCKHIDDEALIYNMGRYVTQRYEKLDTIFKEALKKASIIGRQFDIEKLENPLEVSDASMLLYRIEKMSNLITKKLQEKNKYQFENEQVADLIKSFASTEELIRWNKALALYFSKLISIKINSLNTIELCGLIMQVAQHYECCKEYKNSIFYYFQAVPRLMSAQLYFQAIETVERSKKLIEHIEEKEYSIIFSQAEYRLSECYRYLFNFSMALYHFEKHLRLNPPSQKEKCRSLYQHSLLLYNSGNIERSYKILSELYDDICKNKTHIDRHTVFNIISLLSSVEETLNDVKYTTHFNEALSYAKNNNLTNEYYTLMRKASVVHHGEIGITLMNEAEKYFTQLKNLVECSYTLHNIGNEYLFLNNLERATDYLTRSYVMQNDILSAGVTYTQNSLAILQILKENDYDSALSILQNAFSEHDEPFTQLVIKYNMSTCLRKLKRYDEFTEFFDQTHKINLQEGNKFPYFKFYLILQEALYLKEQNLLHESLEKFIEFFNCEYDRYSEHWVMVIKNITILCEVLKIKIPEKITPYIKAVNPLSDVLLEKNIAFCVLSFWE